MLIILYLIGETKMTDKFTLDATSRADVGKGASRRLRHSGKIPAIIYGANKQPTTINLEHQAVLRALENEAFYSHILTVNLDNKPEKVILRDLQRHPFKPRILHMDLQRISATEKFNMSIPLHFTGETVAPGVKVGGGIISHLLSEVEIRCLPADLPEFVEVDISNLELNQTVHLSDLPLPKGVEIVDLIHNEDKPVVTIYIPRAVVEEETAAPEASPEVEASEVSSDAEVAAAAATEKEKKEKKE